MTNKRNSLLSNLTQNFLLTLITMFTPILILSLISQVLGLEQYGVYATVISYTFIFIVLLDFGFGMELTHRIAMAEGCVLSISNMISSFIFIRLVSILVVSPIFIGTFYLYVSENHVLMFLSLLYFSIMLLNFSWYYQGSEIVKFYSRDVLITRVLLIVLVIFIWYLNLGIEYYLGAQLISSIILIVLNLRRISNQKIIIKLCPNFSYLKILLTSSLRFYFSRLIITLYETGSTFLISRFVNSVETAQYAMMLQIYRAGSSVIGAISMSLYPYMSRQKEFKLLIKVTFILTLILVSIYQLIDYIYPTIVRYVFSENYVETVNIIKIFFIGSIFQVSASFLGYPYFTAINKAYIAHRTSILGSFGYCFIFIYFYIGENVTVKTMAICIVFSVIITTILRIVFYIKNEYRSLWLI